MSITRTRKYNYFTATTDDYRTAAKLVEQLYGEPEMVRHSEVIRYNSNIGKWVVKWMTIR